MNILFQLYFIITQDQKQLFSDNITLMLQILHTAHNIDFPFQLDE